MAEPDEVPRDLDAPILPWSEIRQAALPATRKGWLLLLGVPLVVAFLSGLVQWLIAGGNEKAWDAVTSSVFLAPIITLGGLIVIWIVVQLVQVPLVRARKSIAADRREIRQLRGDRDKATAEAVELREQRDNARRDRDDALRDLEKARRDAAPAYRDSVYRGQRIFLPDLVRAPDASPVVERKTFIDCDLFGPCTIVLLGQTTVQGGEWLGPASSAITLFPDDTVINGPIGLRDCGLVNCRIHDVAIVGIYAQGAMLREGFPTVPINRAVREPSGSEGEGSRSGECAGKSGKDREVGMEGDPIDAPDAERQK